MNILFFFFFFAHDCNFIPFFLAVFRDEMRAAPCRQEREARERGRNEYTKAYQLFTPLTRQVYIHVRLDCEWKGEVRELRFLLRSIEYRRPVTLLTLAFSVFEGTQKSFHHQSINHDRSALALKFAHITYLQLHV